jgi:hypothetical protein
MRRFDLQDCWNKKEIDNYRKIVQELGKSGTLTLREDEKRILDGNFLT